VLRFSVEYSSTKASTGESVECRVRAERIGYRGYGMMLGEVGLPPGVDVDRESLEHALQGNYSIYRYDVLPDRVILYMWPEAGGSVFSLRFRSRFGMSAETAPSLLYDYYNPESSVTLIPSHFVVTQSKQD
jgi:A-macroglobulin receptor binding domain